MPPTPQPAPPPEDDFLAWSSPPSRGEACAEAARDLAIEGLRVDHRQVPPTLAFAEGRASYEAARSALLERHRAA